MECINRNLINRMYGYTWNVINRNLINRMYGYIWNVLIEISLIECMVTYGNVINRNLINRMYGYVWLCTNSVTYTSSLDSLGVCTYYTAGIQLMSFNDL